MSTPDIRPVATAETPARPQPTPNVTAPGQVAPPTPPVPEAPANPNAQSALPAQQNTPAPPPSNPMLPRKFAKPNPTPGPGLAKMLELVSATPNWIEEDRRPNSFLPSFIGIAAVIDAMNQMMITTKKFTESSPQWHPLVSHLYIAVCFYTKMFAVMHEADELTQDQLAAYLTIRENFPTEQMMIPGPLVAHFESLSVSSAAPEHQGNVAPSLPDSPGQIIGQQLVFQAPHRLHLPNVLSLLDQLSVAIAPPALAATPAQDGNPWNLYGADATAASNPFLHTFCGPTYRGQIYIPDTILANYRNYGRLLRLPRRLAQADLPAANTDAIRWTDSLGLSFPGATSRSGWFRQVTSVMQKYSEFFHSSVPLMDIPLIGNGASQVECLYSGTTNTAILASPTFVDATDSTAAHYSRATVTTLEARARTRNPLLPLAHYQTGQLTRINAVLDTNTLRVGPSWSNQPYYLQTMASDFSNNLEAMISANYHSSVPIRRT
jgi:hypothetical protein